MTVTLIVKTRLEVICVLANEVTAEMVMIANVSPAKRLHAGLQYKLKFGSLAECQRVWRLIRLLKEMLLRRLGFRFNPHTRHVVASLDNMIYDAHLCLVELKKQMKWTRYQKATGIFELETWGGGVSLFTFNHHWSILPRLDDNLLKNKTYRLKTLTIKTRAIVLLALIFILKAFKSSFYAPKNALNLL